MTITDTTSGPAADLARALLADGWSDANERRTDPVWGSEIHRLDSPDGALTLQTNDISPECCLAVLTARPVRTPGRRRRSWCADLTVPLPVALAVITAARQPTRTSCCCPGGIEPLLTAAGWHERLDDLDDDEEFDDEDGPTIYSWAAPDDSRSVTWYGPDDDPGFWSVENLRPHDGTTREHLRFTQDTPAPVIAAAALADWPEPTV